MIEKKLYKDNLFWQIIITAITLKSFFLFGFGYITPVYDAVGYIEYANKILNEEEWLYFLDFSKGGLDITAFRSIGYPLIIAICKYFFYENGYIMVVILQNLFSIAVLVYFYILVKNLKISNIIKYIICFIFIFCSNFTHDNAILTDSIFNNSFVLALLLLSNIIVNNSILSNRWALAIGLILAFSYTIRAFAIYAIICILPLVAYIYYKKLGRMQIILVFIPLFLTYIINGAWNYGRSSYFFSVYNYAVPLQPVYKLYALGYDVFDGNTKIDEIAQNINPKIEKFDRKFFSYDHYPYVIQVINDISQYPAPVAMKMQTDIFYRTIFQYPFGIVNKMAIDITELKIMPLFKFLEFTPIMQYHLDPSIIINKPVKGVLTFFDLILFIIIISLFIYIIVKHKEKSFGLIMSLYGCFFLYFGLLLFIHWQNRFLPAVLPILLLACAITLERKKNDKYNSI